MNTESWTRQCSCTQVLIHTKLAETDTLFFRRLGGYMNTARWVDEEAAVREILTRHSKTVDDNRYI